MIQRSKADRRLIKRRGAVVATSVVAALSLAGCTYVPDWANPVDWYDQATGSNVPRPKQIETKENDTVAQGKEQSFPNLSSVPERPKAEQPESREQLAEGLVADRDKARYTDEALRADTEVQAPQAPASIASAPAVPPAATPPASPATPAPVAAPAPKPMAAPQPKAPVASGFENSPTPMIAAMTSKRRAGGASEIPSLRGTAPQAPSKAVAPAPAPSTAVAPVVPPAPRATPTPQPTYPSPTPKPVQSGDVLNQTFASRLQASGTTVSTAPASDAYKGTTAQGYIPQASGTAAAQDSTGAGASALAAPLVPASERVAVIGFSNGSSKLDGKALATIRKIAKTYKERGGIIRVVGHSSSRTRDLPVDQHMIVNFNISLQRAQNVAAAFARRGIKMDNILIEARGDSEPLYFEAMPRGEAENRRVEVYLER